MNPKYMLVLAVLVVSAGCSNAKSATEADFGNSRASLVDAQSANPAAHANPSSEAVTGVDPDYANAVIQAMREDVSKPEEVQDPLAIRVIGQGGN
jgi:hypothetical protein